jgi:serine/threonine protein kinase
MFGFVRLGEKLGEGGMGAVYRGHHVILKKDVAVKLIRPDLLARQDVRDRFLEEAHLAAAIEATEIVRVMDCNVHEGQYYIVMEFVDGGGLDKLIARESPLSVERAAAIALDVARGLRAAHRVGIIHRDIKPENILITRDGRAKIADLGLAKRLLTSLPGPTAGTQVGVSMGSPGYMAPEQIANAKGVDHRADIFSLGATLYEMLKGQKPFRGQTLEEIWNNTRESTPEPVSGDAGRRLGPIIDKMLKKNPDDRYSSYDVLIADMERSLAAPAEASAGDGFPSFPPVAESQDRVVPVAVWQGRRALGLGLGLALLAAGIGIWALRGSVTMVASPRPAGEATKPTTPRPAPAASIAAKVAADTSAGKAAASEAKDDTVAPEVRAALSLAYTKEFSGSVPSAEVRLLAQSGRGREASWRSLPNGAALTSGDRYRVEVRPGSAGHLYVFQVDSRGKLDVIFPRLAEAQFSNGHNPVAAGSTVILPDEERAFHLDDHLGVEQVYAVVTHSRWQEIETALVRASRAAPRPRPVTAPVIGRDRGIAAVVEVAPKAPAQAARRPSGEKVVAMVTGTKGVLVVERWFNHVARPQ